IFTMIPFMFMSFTMDPVIVGEYGMMAFFATYVFLLLLSGLLLLPYGIRHMGGDAAAGVRVAGSETARYAALVMHWLITNSVAICFLLWLFWWYNDGSALFDIHFGPANQTFIVCFVAATVIRNVVDFWTVWPFLYLSRM